MSIPALPSASSRLGDHHPQNRANGGGNQSKGKTPKVPLGSNTSGDPV